MKANLIAVYIALQTVPFLALAAALPYTVRGYLRTKSVNVWRCTYFYSFVLYFLCAYFMTILPLPSAETLAEMRPVRELIQLTPFQSFADIKRETVVRDLAVIAFNVVITVPLGFYLRSLFGCSFKKTAAAGLLVALFYEISQLTGLFFIFPRPWRIFDVDDLMLNTLGALVGFWLTPLIARILPRHSDHAQLRLSQGSEVSFRQRFIAGAVDLGAVLCLSCVLLLFGRALLGGEAPKSDAFRFLLGFAAVMAVAVIYSMIMGADTLGNRLTGLRLTGAKGKKASRLRSTYRMLIEYVCVTAVPFWVYFAMRMSADAVSVRSVLWLALSTGLMLCAARNILEMMFNAVTHGASMFYDRAAKTHLSYNSRWKKPIFGIRVLDILPLESGNVDRLSHIVCDTLSAAGFGRETVTKVRLMTEGVLLDWMDAGLHGALCELRLDTHFSKKALILSVPSDEKQTPASAPTEESYVDMFSKMTLQVESYHAAEKNICIIHIP